VHESFKLNGTFWGLNVFSDTPTKGNVGVHEGVSIVLVDDDVVIDEEDPDPDPDPNLEGVAFDFDEELGTIPNRQEQPLEIAVVEHALKYEGMGG
jgi:hypothetical protein